MKDSVIIPASLFRKMRLALSLANRVLVEQDTRLESMDQNPFGVRDAVGSATLAVERYVKKATS
jgi:hypothetical protein